MEYYVYATEPDANAAIAAINGSGWFPVVGNKNGVPNPSAQKTVAWVDAATEMLSGEWAVPRIPEDRLDYLDVPQQDRDNFLAAYGQDIRDLTSEDFPAPPDEQF